MSVFSVVSGLFKATGCPQAMRFCDHHARNLVNGIYSKILGKEPKAVAEVDWMNAKAFAPLTGFSKQDLDHLYSALPGPSRRKLENLHYSFGTTSSLYEAYGAHLCPEGGKFLVYAPCARKVDIKLFNDNEEQTASYSMKREEGTGNWSIVIPNIESGQRYHYVVNDIGKIDPFSSQIIQSSDWRKTPYSVVGNSSSYTWKDDAWMSARKEKETSTGTRTYELHLPTWMKTKENGALNYQDLATKLIKYLEEHKYTHVELMGLLHHPFEPSWGYQVTGFFAPNSSFGSVDDFKKLVDCLHQKGFGVIVDWIPQHFARDSYGLKDFDGSSLYHPHDYDLHYRMGERNRRLRFGSMHFDYTTEYVRNFLLSSAKFWVKEMHIDGLRVDCLEGILKDNVAPQEATNFLRALNATVHCEAPGAVVIAEDLIGNPLTTQPLWSGGLGFDMKWDVVFRAALRRMLWNVGEYKKVNSSVYKRVHGFVHKAIYPPYATMRNAMMSARESDIAYLSHDEIGDILQVFHQLDTNSRKAGWKTLLGLIAVAARKHTLVFAGSEEGNNVPFFDMIGSGREGLMNSLETADISDMEKYRCELNNLYENTLKNIMIRQWIVDPKEQVGAYRAKLKDGSEIVVLNNFTTTSRDNFSWGNYALNEYETLFSSSSEPVKIDQNGISISPCSIVVLSVLKKK